MIPFACTRYEVTPRTTSVGPHVRISGIGADQNKRGKVAIRDTSRYAHMEKWRLPIALGLPLFVRLSAPEA